MPSTYSPSLGIELIGNGEQASQWGATTNYNLGTLLEQAITGVGNVDMSAGTSVTIVTGTGVVGAARNAVLVLTGSLGASCNLIVPTVNKFYAIRNATTGNQNVVVKTSTGTGVTLANGYTQLMYCDGPNNVVVAATQPFDSVNGNVLINGNVTISKASPVLALSKAASGQSNVITGQTGGSARWAIAPGNSTAESTGNVGSDFTISSYTDGGVYIENPMTITRSSGATALKSLSVTGDITTTGQTVRIGNGEVNSKSLNMISSNGTNARNVSYYLNTDGNAGLIDNSTRTTIVQSNPFSTTSGSATVLVTIPAYGASVNDFVTFSGASAVGGLTLNGTYQIVSTPSSSTFTITAASTATSTVLQPPGGGGTVTAAFQVTPFSRFYTDASGNFTAYRDLLSGGTIATTSNLLRVGNGAATNILLQQWNSAVNGNYYLNTDGTAGFNDTTNLKIRFSSDTAGNFFTYSNITMQNATLDSGIYYSPGLISSPASYQTILRYFHQPDTKAGAQFLIGGVTLFEFRNNGRGYAPDQWINLSDKRVKEDQKTIDDALSKLIQLNGVTYKRNDISEIDGSPIVSVGLLAQDVAAVLPEAVEITGPAPASDPDGPGLMSLSYNGVIALLVNAVKELSAKVDALEKKAAG
jgi:hypothetical protein